MTTTRVLILHTTSNQVFRKLAEQNIGYVVPNGVDVELSFPEEWPTLIVDTNTMAHTIPRLLEQAERAKGRDFDAVLVNQHSDPGIDALREMLDIPVVGLGETSMLLAASLADKFSMVTCRHTRTNSMMAIDLRLARKLGVEAKVASYRAFGGASVLADLLGEGRDQYVQEFVDESKLAVLEDGARAIYIAGSVFGYWLPNLVGAIRESLEEEGFPSLPVVEPMRAGLNAARALADLKVRHW